MKKYLAAAALIGVLGLSGISMATPQNYNGCGNYGGAGYCGNWADQGRNDENTAAFYEETKELRKSIVVKRSELDALMRQDNPDENKVAKLTGELYDLQTTMEEKADKAFAGKTEDSPGPGYGYCRGGRRGW